MSRRQQRIMTEGVVEQMLGALGPDSWRVLRTLDTGLTDSVGRLMRTPLLTATTEQLTRDAVGLE